MQQREDRLRIVDAEGRIAGVDICTDDRFRLAHTADSPPAAGYPLAL
jgi:hypothetical protein